MSSPAAEDERLFGLGTRTLADLIAPSGFDIRADHLRLDGQYARALIVTAYPRLVSPGWLSLLVETDLPIEVSLHVRPLGSAEMVQWLGVQIALRTDNSRLAISLGLGLLKSPVRFSQRFRQCLIALGLTPVLDHKAVYHHRSEKEKKDTNGQQPVAFAGDLIFL